jgi:hypothetical protein
MAAARHIARYYRMFAGSPSLSTIKVLPNIERMKGERNFINTPNTMQSQSSPLSSDLCGQRVKYLITAPTANMIKLGGKNDQ